MRMRFAIVGLLVGLLALLALGMAAAAGGGCAPQDSDHTQGSGTSVEIKGCKFAPVLLFAPVGATVTWTNSDGHPPHNIHGLGWGMNAGGTLVSGGQTKSTFDRPGIYPYQCSLHPGMSGAVIVGDGQVSASAAAPAAAAPESALVAGRTAEREDDATLIAAIAAAALALTAVGAYRMGRGQRSRGSAP